MAADADLANDARHLVREARALIGVAVWVGALAVVILLAGVTIGIIVALQRSGGELDPVSVGVGAAVTAGSIALAIVLWAFSRALQVGGLHVSLLTRERWSEPGT